MGYGFQHEGRTFFPDRQPISETERASAERNGVLNVAEMAAFQQGKTNRVFAYWHKAAEIRTWMGGILARITWTGNEYSCPFGSRRINFGARGIDGRTYSGTYYKSSGDYVRMRVVKGGQR